MALYSEAAAPTMPSEAAQLAVAGFALDDNATTRERLLAQTSAPLPRRLLTPVGPGAVSATGDLLAVGGAGGVIQLVTGSTGALRDAFRARSRTSTRSASSTPASGPSSRSPARMRTVPTARPTGACGTWAGLRASWDA